jgi:hypothetical protein
LQSLYEATDVVFAIAILPDVLDNLDDGLVLTDGWLGRD